MKKVYFVSAIFGKAKSTRHSREGEIVNYEKDSFAVVLRQHREGLHDDEASLLSWLPQISIRSTSSVSKELAGR